MSTSKAFSGKSLNSLITTLPFSAALSLSVRTIATLVSSLALRLRGTQQIWRKTSQHATLPKPQASAVAASSSREA